MGLGAVDLAVLLAGASWLVGSRQGPVGGAPGNLLAGGICLDLLAGTGVVRSLNGKHGLAFAFPVATPTLLRWGGGVFISRVGFCAGVLAGVLPSLFSPGAPIGQNVELGHILNLGHRQLLAHLAIAHVLMERANHSGRMNIGDVILHLTESLDVLA